MATYGITEDKMEMLKQFVQLCKFNVSILNAPELQFFKDWLVNDLNASFPATDPPKDNGDGKSYADAAGSKKQAWSKSSSESEEEESEEEELDIDMEGVIAGDTDPPQDMGDSSREASEEDAEQSRELFSLGMGALNDGDYGVAVKHFTTAIVLDNSRTALFIKRGTAYLRMGKPNASVRDSMKALEINPDSAAAYKVLGKAERLLGNWDMACHNLEVAQRIDFSEDIDEIIREIKPKANKIRDHKLEKQRKSREKELADRMKRVKKAQAAQEKARKEQEKRNEEKMKQDIPNMFNFAGGMPQFDPSQMKEEKSSPSAEKSGPSAEKSGTSAEDTEPKIFEVPNDIDLD